MQGMKSFLNLHHKSSLHVGWPFYYDVISVYVCRTGKSRRLKYTSLPVGQPYLKWNVKDSHACVLCYFAHFQRFRSTHFYYTLILTKVILSQDKTKNIVVVLTDRKVGKMFSFKQFTFLLSTDIRSEGSIAIIKKFGFDFFLMIFDSTSLPETKNVF